MTAWVVELEATLGTASNVMRTWTTWASSAVVSEAPEVRRDALVAAAQRELLPELAVPRDVVAVAALPLLGSGKTDYVGATKLAKELATPAEPVQQQEAEVA